MTLVGEEFQLTKPFQHSNFLFVALVSNFSWNLLNPLRNYNMACQASETLLHLYQHSYSCVLSNLPQHLGSKGKGRSL